MGSCGCNTNSCGNSWLWILILLFGIGNNGNSCNNSCNTGCNTGCEGNNWWWIIILLLLGGGCGNSFSVCEDK